MWFWQWRQQQSRLVWHCLFHRYPYKLILLQGGYCVEYRSSLCGCIGRDEDYKHSCLQLQVGIAWITCVTEFFTGLTKRTCGTFPHHLAVEAAMKSAHLTFIVYFTGAVRTDAFWDKQGIVSNPVFHCATVLGETETASAPVCSCELGSHGSLTSWILRWADKKDLWNLPSSFDSGGGNEVCLSDVHCAFRRFDMYSFLLILIFFFAASTANCYRFLWEEICVSIVLHFLFGTAAFES